MVVLGTLHQPLPPCEQSHQGLILTPQVDTAQALGFAYFPANMFKSPQNWNLTRIFTHSLHMYWPLDSHGYQCLTNPRCVRPEDYTPAADPKHRWDVSRIPKHEIGTLPAWRVFMPTYVSTWGRRGEPRFASVEGLGNSAVQFAHLGGYVKFLVVEFAGCTAHQLHSARNLMLGQAGLLRLQSFKA